MLIRDYLHKKVPEYYKTMHLDGFEPWEIRIALQTKIKKQAGESISKKQIETELEKTLEQALDHVRKQAGHKAERYCVTK